MKKLRDNCIKKEVFIRSGLFSVLQYIRLPLNTGTVLTEYSIPLSFCIFNEVCEGLFEKGLRGHGGGGGGRQRAYRIKEVEKKEEELDEKTE